MDNMNSADEIEYTLCIECHGTGEILQDDGSDSSGTFIDCEYCEDGKKLKAVSNG